MNGLEYFNKLTQEEKDFIKNALIINSDNLENILKKMAAAEVQKILDDWVEKEGIDPTEGSED